MRAAARTMALAGLLASVSCTGAQVSSTSGVTEPIRIESGQFIAGALPGLTPPPASEDAGAGVNPQVEDINVTTTAIEQGAEGLTFSGHATAGSWTVAVRFADMGTGYWVVPVGGLDPTDNNLPTYQFKADFGRGLPPGFHDLLFAAIDANGSSGTQSSLSVCIDTPVPDNLNICAPRRAPPAAVLSLTWNTPVDLDLIVEDPSGAMVGGNVAATASDLDGGGAPGEAIDASDGVLDHSSNANCVIDNIDREDIVWQGPLQSGVYNVWVDLFSACHQASVGFTVSLWLAEGQPDGGQRLVQQPPLAAGVLTASQANGGARPGLYVGAFRIQ